MGNENSVNTDPNSADSGVLGPLDLDRARHGGEPEPSPTSIDAERANRAAADEVDAEGPKGPAKAKRLAKGPAKGAAGKAGPDAETATGPDPAVETPGGDS